MKNENILRLAFFFSICFYYSLHCFSNRIFKKYSIYTFLKCATFRASSVCWKWPIAGYVEWYIALQRMKHSDCNECAVWWPCEARAAFTLVESVAFWNASCCQVNYIVRLKIKIVYYITRGETEREVSLV